MVGVDYLFSVSGHASTEASGVEVSSIVGG
jgi:hypothetical protein